MRYMIGVLLVLLIASLPSAALAQSAAQQLCFRQSKASLDQKISACDELIAKESNEVAVIQTLKSRAQLFFEKKNCNRAIDDIGRIIKVEETRRDQAKVSSISYINGIPEIRRQDPDNAFWSTPLHEYYERRAFYYAYCSRELDRAISDYDEAISFASATWPAYVKWTKTRESKLQDMRPTLFQDRGVAHFYKGASQSAIDDLNEAFRLFSAGKSGPSDVAAVLGNRGNVYAAMAEFEKANADLDEAIRLEPSHSGWYSIRAEIWRLRGNLARALSDHDKAITILRKGSESLAYTRRGDTFRYLGDFKKAIADYDKALSFESNYSAALTGRGLANERDGNLTRARNDFRQAISSTTTDLQVIETAQAHLAALDSGSLPPPIAAAPTIAKSSTSIPTRAEIALLKPVQTANFPSTSQKERRIALIIGNSAYKTVGALANPQKDAEVIATSLRNIGFEKVDLVSEASRESLVNALRAFAEEAEKADWAVVYYAGHGIEVNGANYLIPVDAKLAADRDVQFEAVPLDQVMASVEGAKKLKIVILDACRDNPFAPTMRKTAVPDAVAQRSTAGGVVASRSIGRGLGEVKVSGATLVVYAAKHGQIALDGEGGNSPFAVALVQRLATPGVEINKVFRLIRDDVMEATAGRQEPFTYGSLPGREDFFFVSAK